MKASPEGAPGAGILEALRARAGGRGALSFADFMDVALYDPVAGYYCRKSLRIGYGGDFLTATASSPILGRLVSYACAGLLVPEEPSQFDFVEIGAEDGRCVLDGGPHPFRSTRTIGRGENLALTGRAVVFSNELFDAQPFRRFRYRQGQWRELGVAVGSRLEEIELEAAGPLPVPLPGAAAEGYVIDAPLQAASLARTIAAQPWDGLFIAFDYGKSWEEISRHTPAGTARTYRRHVQGAGLLGDVGNSDLTCHICWDWLVDSLRDAGFGAPVLESQEAFFTLRAGGFIKEYTAAAAGCMSPEKLSLLQLLHPANLGQKFQVLWAIRRPR